MCSDKSDEIKIKFSILIFSGFPFRYTVITDDWAYIYSSLTYTYIIASISDEVLLGDETRYTTFFHFIIQLPKLNVKDYYFLDPFFAQNGKLHYIQTFLYLFFFLEKDIDVLYLNDSLPILLKNIVAVCRFNSQCTKKEVKWIFLITFIGYKLLASEMSESLDKLWT